MEYNITPYTRPHLPKKCSTRRLKTYRHHDSNHTYKFVLVYNGTPRPVFVSGAKQRQLTLPRHYAHFILMDDELYADVCVDDSDGITRLLSDIRITDRQLLRVISSPHAWWDCRK